MILWMTENIGTVIAAFLLICVIVAIIVKLATDSKKGKTSCGCGCSECSMSATCHSKK